MSSSNRGAPAPTDIVRIQISLDIDVQDLLTDHRLHDDSLDMPHVLALIERDRRPSLPDTPSGLRDLVQSVMEAWGAVHPAPLVRLGRGRVTWQVEGPLRDSPEPATA